MVMVNNTEQKQMNGIQQHLAERVAHYTEVVRKVFPSLSSFTVPNVGFYTNKKYSGCATGALHLVEFNTVLAEENREAFDNTIIHEIAHLVIYRFYPLGGKLVNGTFKKVKPHGEEFKHVMIMIGGRPNRTHNYDTSNIKARTRKVEREFPYACGCTGKVYNLTSIRHNRILKGKTYRCGICHCQLTPVQTKEVPVAQFKLAA
jgi:predicted SprT family Zn-dependent metalloprotease